MFIPCMLFVVGAYFVLISVAGVRSYSSEMLRNAVSESSTNPVPRILGRIGAALATTFLAAAAVGWGVEELWRYGSASLLGTLGPFALILIFVLATLTSFLFVQKNRGHWYLLAIAPLAAASDVLVSWLRVVPVGATLAAITACAFFLVLVTVQRGQDVAGMSKPWSKG